MLAGEAAEVAMVVGGGSAAEDGAGGSAAEDAAGGSAAEVANVVGAFAARVDVPEAEPPGPPAVA